MKNLGEPYKILIFALGTDMEELINQKFRHEIKDNHYQFIYMNKIDGFREHTDLSLILTDIHIHGNYILDAISAFAEELNVPFVCVSAFGDMENIRKAMNEGATDFLTMPVDFADLYGTMLRAIRSRKIAGIKEIKERIDYLKTELNRYEELSKKYPNDFDYQRELYGSASKIHALEWVLDIIKLTNKS